MGLTKSVVRFFFSGQGIGRVKSTMYSTISSESSLNRPPESLSQDILGGDGVAVGHLLGV